MSITKVEFVEESSSVQIISNIFIDDIEDVLQERYRPDVSLATTKETEVDVQLLKKYILQKFDMSINGKDVDLNYLGHEYDVDMVKIYIEVENVSEFNSVEISNEILLDMFEEQQNIVHLKKDKKRRSMVLDRDNPKGMLNFD